MIGSGELEDTPCESLDGRRRLRPSRATLPNSNQECRLVGSEPRIICTTKQVFWQPRRPAKITPNKHTRPPTIRDRTADKPRGPAGIGRREPRPSTCRASVQECRRAATILQQAAGGRAAFPRAAPAGRGPGWREEHPPVWNQNYLPTLLMTAAFRAVIPGMAGPGSRPGGPGLDENRERKPAPPLSGILRRQSGAYPCWSDMAARTPSSAEASSMVVVSPTASPATMFLSSLLIIFPLRVLGSDGTT